MDLNMFNYKIKGTIVTHVKDDANVIVPWIIYHFDQGFEHFIIYDDCSTDNTIKLVEECSKKYGITLSLYSANNPPHQKMRGSALADSQIRCYKHAAQILKDEDPQWVAFMDVDEFLVPKSGNVIKTCNDLFLEIGEHLYVQSFDIDDRFTYEEFYLTSEYSRVRWEYESRQKTMYKERGKTIINNKLLSKPVGGVHGVLADWKEMKFVNHEILRIHHFRKPNQDKMIKLIPDDTLYNLGIKLKEKYNL